MNLDQKTIARYSAYFFLIVITAAYFLGAKHFTNQFDITDNKGRLVSGLSGEALPLGTKLSGSIAQQRLTVKDWGFLVNYDYILDLAVPQGIPGVSEINFELKLPGKIMVSNSDRENELFWEKLPANGIIKASTRSIRWWLIILLAVLISFNLYIRISLRRNREISSDLGS